MKILNATVKFPAGKVFPTKFGNSQNAKCVLDNGTEIAIWCKADENHEIKKWKKGDKVQILEKDGKYQAIETDKPFPETKAEKAETDVILNQYSFQQVPNIEPLPQKKMEIMKYIEFQKRMYHHIFNQVSDEMKDIGLKDDLLKDISTSIFIQTNKRFTL